MRALKGATLAKRRSLADAALAAWVGAQLDKDGLRRFLDDLEAAPGKVLPPEAQGHALQSMASNLGAISMDEYRARIRAQKRGG